VGAAGAPAEFVDDAVGYRQPQAQSFAHRLGGEEGIEDAGQVRLIDARSVIGDFQAPVLAVAAQGQLDAWLGAVGHCVQCVADQVDQHLLQADRVAQHPGR